MKMECYLVVYGHERLSQTLRVAPVRNRDPGRAKAKVEALFPGCYVVGVYNGWIGRTSALQQAHGSLPLYSGYTAPLDVLRKPQKKLVRRGFVVA
jgi:hypothetical protein